jgi:hypothetical protein
MNMNTRTAVILVAAIVVVAALIALGFWIFSPAAQPVTGTGGTFPSGGFGTTTSGTGTSGSTGSTQAGTGAMTIATPSGGQVTTKDFIHNGTTIPDVENDNQYLIAGSLGYCEPGLACTAASTPDFNIFYNADTQSFTIGIAQEPIGQSRHEAEEFMLSALGIEQDQLCALNYYVGVPYWVNEAYSGKNLGFSFCPGATPLPL